MKFDLNRFLAGALTLALAATFASAQNAAPPTGGGTSGSNSNTGGKDEGILSGPKVEPDAGREGPRGDRPRARRGDRPIDFKMWYGFVQELSLTSDQKSGIDAIEAEFREAIDKFRADNLDKLRETQEQRKNGEEPSKERRQQMRELEEQRPKPEPFQTRIWAILDQSQQAELTKKIETTREEFRKRREQRQRDAGGLDEMRPQAPEAPKPNSEKGGAAGGDGQPKGPPARGQGDRAKRRADFLRSRQAKPAGSNTGPTGTDPGKDKQQPDPSKTP